MHNIIHNIMDSRYYSSIYIIVAMVATIELCGMHKEMSTFRSCVCILEYRSRKTHVLLF